MCIVSLEITEVDQITFVWEGFGTVPSNFKEGTEAVATSKCNLNAREREK
jgi:hypothetical protein